MNDDLNIILNISKLIESSFGVNGKFKLISQVFDYTDNEKNQNIPNENDNALLSTQKLILTNDGLKILKSLNNNSIYYKLLLNESIKISKKYGSGVSQFIIIIGNLLKESIKLIKKKGFTINEILNEWRECRVYLKKFQFSKEPILINENKLISINFNIKENFIENYLKSIIKINLSKNPLNNYIDNIFTIIRNLLKILPKLDKDKIKIKTILNEDSINNQDETEEDVKFELFNGMLFESTFSFAGKDKLNKIIKNPKILLLNYEIELKHQKEFSKINISTTLNNNSNNNNKNEQEEEEEDIGKIYLKFINNEKDLLFDQLKNIYKNNINLILNKKIIGDLAIQEFVKNESMIQCNGLIQDKLFQEIVKSTGGIEQSSLISLSNNEKFYGTCKLYKQITIGKKSFELLEGLNDSTQTIILKGSSKQNLKQFKQGLLSLLQSLRSIIINDNFNVVGGNGNFELSIINLLSFKKDQESDIKKSILINGLIKCFKNFIKLLLINSNINLELFDQLIQFNNLNNQNFNIINFENNSIDSIKNLNCFESNSMKFSIINSSIELLLIFLNSK